MQMFLQHKAFTAAQGQLGFRPIEFESTNTSLADAAWHEIIQQLSWAPTAS
jgi:hypothetical protein